MFQTSEIIYLKNYEILDASNYMHRAEYFIEITKVLKQSIILINELYYTLIIPLMNFNI